MASPDMTQEDTKDGSPTLTIPPITNTATINGTADPTVDAAANADTNMTADTALATNTAATTASTTNATATDSTATSIATTTSTNNHVTVHRTVKTIRKVAKRTPFPIAVAGAPVTVAAEEEGRTTTTATALQVVDDTHTQELETSSIKVTQEEGEEPVSEDDDSERRDASTANPVAAADLTPITTDVPTTTNKTMTAADKAKILKMAVEPRLNDVLFVDDNCQEDSKINKKWPGNRQYRAWIQARVFEFQKAANRSEQTRLAKQVSGLVRQQSPVGRFLERLSYPVDGSSNATATATDSDKKTKSVWVELDETAVLMELSKSLWESPLENNKLSDKQQQMLISKQEASLRGDSGSLMKNGDNNKNVNNNDEDDGNENDIIANGSRTSRHEQQLLLQHAKAASQYGDYFHTLYITPVYSNSQSPSVNTAASMMQQKQQQRDQQPQQQKKRQQQRKPFLAKSASASTKRRPSLNKSQDDNDVEMDIHVGSDDDDDDGDDRSERSVDDSKLGKNNGKTKRKSYSNDKKPKPKRNNSNSADKPKAPRRSNSRKADAKQRTSNGTIVVSPLSVPSEPARKKARTTVTLKTKPYRGDVSSPLPKKKKGERKSVTTTDELGLPRGVTMRPSGKWVRTCNVLACVKCCGIVYVPWLSNTFLCLRTCVLFLIATASSILLCGPVALYWCFPVGLRCGSRLRDCSGTSRPGPQAR
jgi:hypothetical protein